jgi:tetratricopeptide (TPR) repeat protein
MTEAFDRLPRARLQKWVYCAMRTLLSRAIRVDPSFHVGLGLIVILAVIEVFFATSYYVGRARAARVSAQAIAATIARPAAPAVPLQTPAPAPVQPAVSTAAAVSTPSPSLVDQLLREGIELRDRGDTTNALARLQEALDSEPNNTAVLEEMAKTYESMQLLDRANEIWRKLQEMGPSVGAAYELAAQRLKMGVPAPEPVDSGIANSSADATENKETEHRDIGGNPEGPVMGITQVKTTDTSDPDTEKNMALQIGIKKQPGTTIDHDKVRIFVKFYDTVGDKDIKLTDADVNYEWLTPKHDWTETNPEVLSVKYIRPKTSGAASESSLSEVAATVRPGQKGRGAKGSTADSGRRKYLGYIIQVYYDDELQAVQAEPSRLLQLFPPSKGTSAR